MNNLWTRPAASHGLASEPSLSLCTAVVRRSCGLSKVSQVQMGRRCNQVPASSCSRRRRKKSWPCCFFHWGSDISQQSRREHLSSCASSSRRWCSRRRPTAGIFFFYFCFYNPWPCILLAAVHSHHCSCWQSSHALHFLQDHRPCRYPSWVSSQQHLAALRSCSGSQIQAAPL